MHTLTGAAALAALIVCAAAPVLFFTGSMSESGYRALFLAASLVYFPAATLWVAGRKKR
jgi:hypothetical protein